MTTATPVKGRPGRKPKAGVIRTILPSPKVLPEHASLFEKRASAVGLSMTDYITMCMYQAEGIDVPAYITDQIEKYRRDQANDLQQPLMTG